MSHTGVLGAFKHWRNISDEELRWYAVTMGMDRNGSYNVITVFGGSDRGFLGNRLRHLKNVRRSEK